MRTCLTILARSNGSAVVVCCLVGFASSHAHACDYLTMRDAGFDEPRDVHRLCVFGKTTDPDARVVHDRLDNWIETEGKDLNVALEYVAVDDPEMDWAEFGIPSAPSSTPVVALIGNAVGRKNWVIHHWQPSLTDADLDQLRDSPARQAIRREAPRRLAVVVYIPPADPGGPKAGPVINQAVSDWANRMEQDLGLAVVTVDRSDEREQFLLSFMGPEPNDSDWIALVFGRGKFMPPLEGQDITQANLDAQLEELMVECTCYRSPGTLGVDVPMAWEQVLNKQIVRLKTEDEAAVTEIHESRHAPDSPTTPLTWTVTAYSLTAFPVLVGVIAGGVYVIRHGRSRPG